MAERRLDEIMGEVDLQELGMLLVHNGVVRRASRSDRPVGRKRLLWDRERLARLLREQKAIAGLSGKM